jgi:ketosteroid isomerase-like protein
VSEELIRGFVRDLNSRDLTKIATWFADDAIVSIPPQERLEGARRALAFFRSVFRLYEEMHWEVGEVLPVGPRRFVYFTESHGRFRSGAAYRNSIVTVIHFDEAGRITFLSDYFKDTTAFTS